ncbi:hypothetical protein [Pseudodesulfovibrio sp.]|uniref:hypothetical protein n=1 Tax=Pseudodesulfovibrio sp. TaxID=2035812 RepID=UPI00261E9AB9|nr:hypothetical protein [Pseudodesulfovibrio sp.]MDD3312440.1 hypothetical protein [Pseudodesulfovibrio sp.]
MGRELKEREQIIRVLREDANLDLAPDDVLAELAGRSERRILNALNMLCARIGPDLPWATHLSF